MPIDDDDKRMPASDSELAEDCATLSKQLDRKLKAELGVAPWEQLMIALRITAEFRDIDDNATPEEEAAAIAARLGKPVAVVNYDNDQVLAFARPRKHS